MTSVFSHNRVSHRQGVCRFGNGVTATLAEYRDIGSGPAGGVNMTRYLVGASRFYDVSFEWSRISQAIGIGGWAIIPGISSTIALWNGAGVPQVLIMPSNAERSGPWVMHFTYDGTTVNVYSNGILASSAPLPGGGYTPAPVTADHRIGYPTVLSPDDVSRAVLFLCGSSDTVTLNAAQVATHADQVIDACEQGRNPVPTFPGQEGQWDASDISPASLSWADQLGTYPVLARTGPVEQAGFAMTFVEQF